MRIERSSKSDWGFFYAQVAAIYVYMTYAHILSQRPFSIEDGDRYLIVCSINGTNKVLTRSYKNKPIFTPEFKEAKTFKEVKTVENCLNKLIIPHEYEYQVYRIKDLFEARYYVKLFEEKVLAEAHIKSFANWYIKGENPVNTYTDYNTAKIALAKSKADLVEVFYKKIFKIRLIDLAEIKKGVSSTE